MVRGVLKVMVLEDNSLLPTSLSDARAGDDIDGVASCATASEAVEELRRVKIDVLVTDLDWARGPRASRVPMCCVACTPWRGW